ncbi:trehalase family glycosidase, partial [Xanthomonas fragariae]
CHPLQDGFGWTNGVTLMLLNLYPSPDTAKPPAKEARKAAPAAP